MWTDLASGQITSALGSIAVPTLLRSPRLPEAPTYAEQGFKARKPPIRRASAR